MVCVWRTRLGPRLLLPSRRHSRLQLLNHALQDADLVRLQKAEVNPICPFSSKILSSLKKKKKPFQIKFLLSCVFLSIFFLTVCFNVAGSLQINCLPFSHPKQTMKKKHAPYPVNFASFSFNSLYDAVLLYVISYNGNHQSWHT